MRKSLVLIALAVGLCAQSGAKLEIEPRGEYKVPDNAPVLVAQIIESKQSGGYVYFKVKNEGRTFWVVTNPNYAGLKPDTFIRFKQEVHAPTFESKSLGTTLEDVVFTTELEFMNDLKKEQNDHFITEKVTVSPYTKSGNLNLREIYEQKDKLKGKKIIFNAKVVRVSKNIQGKNWIHLQDGTGVEDLPLRIVATSSEDVTVGDIVEITGTVETNKEFGTGFVYKIIIENSTFKR